MKPAKIRRSIKLIIPFSIILMLFCSGIYLGATRRQTVLAFEQKYLDMDMLEGSAVHHPLEGLLEPAKATMFSNALLSSVPTANAAPAPRAAFRSAQTGQGVSEGYRPSPPELAGVAPGASAPNPNAADVGGVGRPLTTETGSVSLLDNGSANGALSSHVAATPPSDPALRLSNGEPVQELPSNRAQNNPMEGQPMPSAPQATGLATAPPDQYGVGQDPIDRRSEPSEPPPTGLAEDLSPQGAGSLRDLYELPVTIRVKVLADEAFVAHDTDWMANIQTVIAEVSRIYRNNFGIEVKLIGLGQWPLATTGRTAARLYADLTTRETEGADVLLGFVDRELDTQAYMLSNSAESVANKRFSLVGKTGGSNHSPFLKGTLRSLGHLLGAREVEDVNSPEYQLGSWMSAKPLPDRQSPWIGAENRKRILQNKIRPFSVSMKERIDVNAGY